MGNLIYGLYSQSFTNLMMHIWFQILIEKNNLFNLQN